MRAVSNVNVMVAAISVVLPIAGGGCFPVPVLPSSLDVATTAADRVSAAQGTGPSSLAGGTWSLTRVADAGETPSGESPAAGPYGGLLEGRSLPRPPAGERIFLARFGADGQMVEVTENRFFLREIYGETVPVGGDWTAATLPGVAYQSASYGVQDGDRFGLAAIVNVRFCHIFLGRATLYAWGTTQGDQLQGTFGYLIDFTEGAVSALGMVSDQYAVTGERVGG